MKLQGFVGKGTGKLGASVWAVRKGVQVVREYTNRVSNPNTRPQVVQRAKFKLLTQVSAIVRDALSYANIRQGESAGNVFMKRNMNAVDVPFDQSHAILEPTELEISDSNIAGGTLVYNVEEGTIEGRFQPADGWQGMRVAIIVTPSVGRVYGQSIISETIQPSAGRVEVQFVPNFPDARKTTILGVFWRYKDAEAEAKYKDADGEENKVRLKFDRMVAAGDIVFSKTIVATQA